MKDNKKDTSVWIREILDMTGLRPAHFGRKYHIPPNTLHDWEHGNRTPPVYVLEWLERIVREDMEKQENREEKR